jgi:ribosomal-protein-alanine N-acetyltransferase
MRASHLGSVLAIEQESSSPWSASAVVAELQRPGSMVVVAKIQESASRAFIAGWYCALLVFPEAELLKIGVRQSHRRRGVAQTMFKHLIAKISLQKYTSLSLEVRSKNLVAMKFYGKNDFIEVAKRAKYYSNPADDALILRKALP